MDKDLQKYMNKDKKTSSDVLTLRTIIDKLRNWPLFRWQKKEKDKVQFN